MVSSNNNLMWVFGYGSLIWKVDFPYDHKIVGYIKGFVRRFYQYSIDHRGTQIKPGRVVTLVPTGCDQDTVWGVAYCIKPEDAERVSQHLDFREKNGYQRLSITFYPNHETVKPFDLTIYVATMDNVSFAGDAPIERIAQEIVSCVGPSGTNKEYLYKLAEAMRNIAPHVSDEHLYMLEKAVKQLDSD